MGRAQRPSIWALLHHRNPRLVLLGQSISSLGDGIATVAFTLLVIDTTHSVTRLGWFAAARLIPLVIFLLVGGAVVDRFSRRTLMLLSDLGRVVLTALVTGALIAHVLTFNEILAVGFLFGAFDAVFMPAFSALVPEITPPELLNAMNAARPIALNLMGFAIGPAIGGIIVSVSTTWAIGADCVTFLFSTVMLAQVRGLTAPLRATTTSVRHDIREGLRYCRETPWLWWTLLGVILTNGLVGSPLPVLLSFYLRHTLHSSSDAVGNAYALFGCAGALGALLASGLRTPRRRVRWMWGIWGVATLSATTFLFAHNFASAMIFPMVAAPLWFVGDIIWNGLLQTEVPRSLLGRVSSIDALISFGLNPVGILVATWLSAMLGVQRYFLIMGLVTVLPSIVILSSRRVNAVDEGR